MPDDFLPDQIFEEGSSCGQLPRNTFFAQTLFMEIAKEQPESDIIDLFQAILIAGKVAGEEIAQLKKVVLIRIDGVRRIILLNPQILQEVFYVILHRFC